MRTLSANSPLITIMAEEDEEMGGRDMHWVPSQWSVAKNDASLSGDLRSAAAAEALDAVTPKGDFAIDYCAFCGALRIFPHPKIMAPLAPAPKTFFPWHEKSKQDGETQPPGTRSIVKVKQMAVDLASIHALALALPAAKTITTLSFYDAALSSKSIELLAETLPETVVSSLAIDYNPLRGATSSATFALLLKVEGNLSSVSLRGNAIDSVGGIAVGKALAGNTSIGALNLFNNRLGNVGTCDIARALRFNVALKQLSLSRNEVRLLFSEQKK